MKKVSLGDIAKYCGVSRMTVSRVVNGVQSVKEETRKRVEEAVAKFGYQPDPLMRLMRAASSRSNYPRERAVGLAYLDYDCDAYSLDIFEKARDAASALGYEMKYFKCPAEMEAQRQLSRQMWMQGIQGLLFATPRIQLNISGFELEKFVLIGFGAKHHIPPIDTVGSDFFENLIIAANRCHELGMRRIGLRMSHQRDAYTGHRWFGAYSAFCHRKKLKLLYFDPEENPGQDFVDWVTKNRIEAIIGLQGIRSFQKLLPNVFFACLNDWQAIEQKPVAEAGHVLVPRELLAKEAVALLDYKLLRRNYGVPSWPRHISFEGQWSDLKSSEAQPRSSRS